MPLDVSLQKEEIVLQKQLRFWLANEEEQLKAKKQGILDAPGGQEFQNFEF